jgi:hypothetical protein
MKPSDGDKLPDDWYSLTIAEGANRDLPGLYEFKIDGVGSYIGKYTNFSERCKLYSRNVNNLLNKRAYRKGKPDGFRRIHRELADAFQAGKTIKLIILENQPRGERLNRREWELIMERGTLNGPLPI